MKKLLALALAVVMLLAFTACGDTKPAETPDVPENKYQEAPNPERNGENYRTLVFRLFPQECERYWN